MTPPCTHPVTRGHTACPSVCLSPSPPLQADKRAHHNALERKRRDHIKDSFHSLRDSVPSLQGEKVRLWSAVQGWGEAEGACFWVFQLLSLPPLPTSGGFASSSCLARHNSTKPRAWHGQGDGTAGAEM